MKTTMLSLILLFSSSLLAQDPLAIVQKAEDKLKGEQSYAEMSMTIVRPNWNRTIKMKSWSRGTDYSLILITQPARDKGTVFLKKRKEVYNWIPSIERQIKLPPSMMNQSWMGSDFSNKDVARSAEIIDQYHHSLVSTESSEGHKVYVIQSIPKEDAPVVWGKEVLHIRDDYVMLQHTFYDQDMQPVKRMKTSKVGMMGGRMVAIHERMAKLETPNEYTEITIIKAKFDIKVPESMFTLSNLRNPRL